MIDHDDAEAPPSGPRSRLMIYLAASLAALVLAGVAIAVAVHRAGTADDHGVRFEAETRSGSAVMITWFIGDRKAGQEINVKTPWSASLSEVANRDDVPKSVIVTTGPDDEATCRIIVDGKVIVERTALKVGACAANLKKP